MVQIGMCKKSFVFNGTMCQKKKLSRNKYIEAMNFLSLSSLKNHLANALFYSIRELLHPIFLYYYKKWQTYYFHLYYFYLSTNTL